MRRPLVLACCTLALATLHAVPPARAADPGRWVLVGKNRIKSEYYQGVASTPRGTLFFDGIFTGLYRTDTKLRQTAGTGNVIPADVNATEGYNHIGDIAYDRQEGGRVLLPLECYSPGAPGGSNTCGTGSIGVADPNTLAWRYYVKLDPAEIPKAMFCVESPDGKLLWTSSGNDLLAYDVSQISAANAAPVAAPIHAVQRLVGAVPPSGITGAAFVGQRLFVAGEDNGRFQVWSIDVSNGKRRLEIERPFVGESEGLDERELVGGSQAHDLYWIVTPFTLTGKPPTFGSKGNALLHFVARAKKTRLRISVGPPRANGRRRVNVQVSAVVLGSRAALAGVRVRFAGRTRVTRSEGVASFLGRLAPGRYRAVATRAGL